MPPSKKIIDTAKKVYDKVNKAASEHPAARTGLSLGATAGGMAYQNKKDKSKEENKNKK